MNNIKLYIILALTLYSNVLSVKGNNEYIIKNGIVELSDYDFNQRQPIDIKGYANFFHNQFLSLQEIENSSELPSKLLIEKSWDNLAQVYNRYPVQGFGTYHFKVIIPDRYVGDLFIMKSSVFNAYASDMKVNGISVCYNGSLGTSNNDPHYKSGRNLEFRPFIAKSNVLDVVVHVANFTQFRGGMFHKIEFGLANAVIKKQERRVAFDALAVIGLFTMFLYHFILSFIIGNFDFNKRVSINPEKKLTDKIKFYILRLFGFDRIAFYFSLVSLIYALDYSLQNSMSFFVFFPNAKFELLLPFQQSLNYMIAPFFCAFIYAMFPQEVSIKVRKLLIIIATTIIALLFLSWGGVQKYIFKYHQVYLLILTAYTLYIITKAIINKRVGAVLFAFSFGVLICCSIIDMLAVFGLTKYTVLHAYGFLFFTLVISFIQGKRITNLFRNNSNLTDRLKEMNAGLEKQVESRTMELNNSLQHLKKLSDFKADMSHMLVHDLKASIQTVINAKIVLHHPKGVGAIQQAGYNMQNLVTNVLDVYKNENAKIDLDLERHDITKIVKVALEEIRFMAQQHTLSFNTAQCLPYTIMVDGAILKRVIVNLLFNAVRFSPRKGVIKITTSCNEHQLLTVSVINQGPGIPKEKQKLIFERFGQGEKRSTNIIGSTGLGLAFCKMAIEAHGGMIDVESEAKSGVRFYFTIPIAINQEVESRLSVNHDVNDKFMSEDDKDYLRPFVHFMCKHRVYEVSSLRKIIKDIDPLQSVAIEQWKEQMNMAIYNCDKNLFNKLIDKVKHKGS